jgi:hypothetical protein
MAPRQTLRVFAPPEDRVKELFAGAGSSIHDRKVGAAARSFGVTASTAPDRMPLTQAHHDTHPSALTP